MHLSVFTPASPQARDLLWLWNACMFVCGFILVVVSLSLFYIVLRYRRLDDREPNQTTGNKKLEIAWTAIPLALITVLFVLSVMTARAVDRPVTGRPDILVTGHQWWWEVRYREPGFTTANEMHLPVGRDMLIGVESADVIHDFWVPRLGRKIDAVPGRRTYVWIRADAPGDYKGVCAEFCGAQHAWMRFRVVAEDPATYGRWSNNQAESARSPVESDAKLGEARFGQLTCANCHSVRGINSQRQYGPDLTHLASRKMLAAERLENTPDNLRDWLHEPNLLKPNCLMPNLKLSNGDLTQLTAFLGGLK